MSDAKQLTQLIEEAVENGTTTVEDIHRSIANLPFAVLECLDLFEKTAMEARTIHDTSVGAIYDLIRDINSRMAEFAGELLEQREGCEHSRQ
jgi:hypothetical protein